MTTKSLSDDAQSMFDEMKKFVRENTARWVKSGWTHEDARNRSLDLLEGLMDQALRPEVRELL